MTRARLLLLAFAGVLTLMAVSQLTSFEEIIGYIAAYTSQTESSAIAVTLIVIALEILALPALLGLQIHSVVRALSMWAILLAPLSWLLLMLVGLGVNAEVTSGLFGKYLFLPVGIVAILYSLLLTIWGALCWQQLKQS